MTNPTSDFTPTTVQLRDVIDSDIPIFFEQSRDPDAVYMAAFTSKDPNDRTAFDTHWNKIRANTANRLQTILYQGQVAGNIASFPLFDVPSVGYWIGKEYWGKGIATEALTQFLAQVETCPLYARVVQDNLGSRRVLEKCGFVVTGEDKGFAEGRGAEVAEYILVLTDRA